MPSTCCSSGPPSPSKIIFKGSDVFMDKWCSAHGAERVLDVRALKKSCIHFAHPDGKMIPFESCNLLYRSGEQLATIRAGIAQQTAQRKGASKVIPIGAA